MVLEGKLEKFFVVLLSFVIWMGVSLTLVGYGMKLYSFEKTEIPKITKTVELHEIQKSILNYDRLIVGPKKPQEPPKPPLSFSFLGSQCFESDELVCKVFASVNGQTRTLEMNQEYEVDKVKFHLIFATKNSFKVKLGNNEIMIENQKTLPQYNKEKIFKDGFVGNVPLNDEQKKRLKPLL